MSEKRHYFDELADTWDTIPRPPDAPEKVASFCRRACSRSPRLVLDVGAGTGVLLPALLRIVPLDAVIVEMDYAHRMLVAGSRKFADPRIGRVCGDALAAPLGQGRFDAVLCFGLLPHLGKTGLALKRLWPLVRPGGSISIGHLMGSIALNERHAGIGGPVAHDRLPPADEVASICIALGAVQVEANDGPDGYFVGAVKEGS